MSSMSVDVVDALFGSQTVVSNVALAMDEAGEECAVLFAAICGSARLIEKLGETEASHAVERCLARMERAVLGCAGRIVKQLNGELLALFDRADEAAQAAIDMQVRVADLPPISGVKLAVRAAFSCGTIFREGDGVCGAVVSRAAALAGMAGAGQVLTGETGQAALSPAWRKATEARDAHCGDERVYGLRSVESAVVTRPEPVAPAVAATSADLAGKRLCLRYRGEVRLIADEVLRLSFGRDAESDFVIHDRRASRHHARVERRAGGRWVLIDSSTNGTYLHAHGRNETFLHHSEGALAGKGRIAFAGSASLPGADTVEYELL